MWSQGLHHAQWNYLKRLIVLSNTNVFEKIHWAPFRDSDSAGTGTGLGMLFFSKFPPGDYNL